MWDTFYRVYIPKENVPDYLVLDKQKLYEIVQKCVNLDWIWKFKQPLPNPYRSMILRAIKIYSKCFVIVKQWHHDIEIFSFWKWCNINNCSIHEPVICQRKLNHNKEFIGSKREIKQKIQISFNCHLTTKVKFVCLDESKCIL